MHYISLHEPISYLTDYHVFPISYKAKIYKSCLILTIFYGPGGEGGEGLQNGPINNRTQGPTSDLLLGLLIELYIKCQW